jgi:hypothetical protein
MTWHARFGEAWRQTATIWVLDLTIERILRQQQRDNCEEDSHQTARPSCDEHGTQRRRFVGLERWKEAEKTGKRNGQLTWVSEPIPIITLYLNNILDIQPSRQRRKLIETSGERGRTRTCDPCLKRALLYQLSYAPHNHLS